MTSLDPSGVHLWLREVEHPSRLVSLRIVVKNPDQGAPNIFYLDCPEERFEEELPFFIDTHWEFLSSQTDSNIGVIGVGHFKEKELQDFFAPLFKNLSLNRHSAEVRGRVSFFSSTEIGVTSLSLYYPAFFKQIKTKYDLKKLWVLYLLQEMVHERLRRAAVEMELTWESCSKMGYLLPLTHTMAQAKQTGLKEPINMLVGFLVAMQELKGGGITEAELSDAKSKLRKHLTFYYQREPDTLVLADYYASLFAFGAGCPDYSIFAKKSSLLAEEIEMNDIIEAIKESLEDKTIRVEIKGPPDIRFTESDFQEALEEFKSDLWIPNKKEEEKLYNSGMMENKEPYQQLVVSPTDAERIRSLVKTIASESLTELFLKRKQLKKMGTQIHHVHPIRFLGIIVSDPNLKSGMIAIEKSFFKWSSFIQGLSERLNEEYDHSNLAPYIPGFCDTIKANPIQVQTFMKQKKWSELVKYLIQLPT